MAFRVTEKEKKEIIKGEEIMKSGREMNKR